MKKQEPQKKEQTRKRELRKEASADRLRAALAAPMPDDITPQQALESSNTLVQDLRLFQSDFRRMLRAAIKAGNAELIFSLKETMVRTAGLIEAYVVSALVAGDFVRKFEAQRKEIARLEKDVAITN